MELEELTFLTLGFTAKLVIKTVHLLPHPMKTNPGYPFITKGYSEMKKSSINI